MSKLTLQEKLRLIDESTSMADLPIDAMPISHRENYYFVSYSHKDYKMVFRDILRFEEMGINIWYDSEMHIGENWCEIAQMYISKFQCKGIIFYLTENSISSTACNEEVEYVLTHNKTFFSINKALDGFPVESGYSMLRRMIWCGFKCSPTLLKNFSRAFSDQILFLSYDSDVDIKIKHILSIKGEDLLCVEKAFSLNDEKTAKVIKCRDSTILTLDLSKQYDVDGNGDYRPISEIGDCAFTNCFKLQSVKMVPAIKIINANAFRNCTELANIDLSSVKEIKENAFEGCTSLKIEKLYAKTYKNAFKGVPLSCLYYEAAHPELGDYSFAYNKSLEEFHIALPFYRDIGSSVFDSCCNLKFVGPFITATVSERATDIPIKIGSYCFKNCLSLEGIIFRGEWDFSEANGLFAFCKKLRHINADISGTVIPERFAYHCENLEEITNSSHFIEIKKEAFYKCKSLKTFDLSSVTVVGYNAFVETGISNVNLTNVISVGMDAFVGSKIEKLTIGENCIQIGDGAFANCSMLRVVKILSINLKEPARIEATFINNSIHVLYLKCAIYDKFLSECEFPKLRLIYISDQVYRDGFEREKFAETQSDINGYHKFYNVEVDINYVADEDIDWQSEEINKEDFNFPKFAMNNLRSLVGQEIMIKHSLAHNPKQYFIEQIVTIAGQDSIVDYAMVSIHRGKSFKLDGTMIESVSPAEYDFGEYLRGGLSVNGLPEHLEGKMLRISANGKQYFGTCVCIDVMDTSLSNNMFVVGYNFKEDRRIIQSIIISDEGHLQAISGRDVKSFAVFNDDFEVTNHFERNMVFNPCR